VAWGWRWHLDLQIRRKCSSVLSCFFLPLQVQIQNKKVDLSKVSSKCGSKANIKHKPGRNVTTSSWFVCRCCTLFKRGPGSRPECLKGFVAFRECFWKCCLGSQRFLTVSSAEKAIRGWISSSLRRESTALTQFSLFEKKVDTDHDRSGSLEASSVLMEGCGAP